MSRPRVGKNLLKILGFWRDIEFFLPFDLDDVLELERAIPLTSGLIKQPPWQAPEAFSLDSDKEYGFDLFLAPFPKAEISHKLALILPAITSEFIPDPREFSGLSCLARISIGSQGNLNAHDLSISTLPWALEQLCSGGTLSMHGFDAFAETVSAHISAAANLREESLSDNAQSSGNSACFTLDALTKLNAAITAELQLNFCPEGLLGVVLPYVLRKKPKPSESGEQPQEVTKDGGLDEEAVLRKKRKVDILNSFYLRDLELAYGALQAPSVDASSVIKAYLHAPWSQQEKLNVFAESSRSVMLSLSSPYLLPLGRWPAGPEVALSLNQLVALNRYLSDAPVLQSVNGPPGTGKTTLVRELVAAKVVERAAAISKLSKPGDAFESTTNESRVGRKNIKYRRLKKELTGFEIVIASSNNAAVENISKELPKVSALGDEFKNVSYLVEMARLYRMISEETNDKDDNHNSAENSFWGLPSVALGNSRNRKLFRKAAFLGPREESEKSRKVRQDEIQALSLFEWRKRAPLEGVSFQAAKKHFREALEEVEKHREIAANEITPSEFPAIVSAEAQLTAPGQNCQLNMARSKAFIAALTLLEAWIREVPKLEQELYAVSALIGSPSVVDSRDAPFLWQLLFMIVPVVSTTLASVERMFSSLRPGSIANVIVDEAGQATPQSVVGLLLRAKKALFIGDQRQLEPVVVISSTLERTLAQKLDERIERLVSPLSSSAQVLADTQNPLGTFFGDESNRVWVGLPLCVHRRCCEPMFHISNELCYNGIMIKATADNIPISPLGPSCWFQVGGSTTVRHWVPAHGSVCSALLQELLSTGAEISDIFVISPFREVKRRLKEQLSGLLKQLGYSSAVRSELRKRIGTIHSFQGKEAKTVLLVLGCDFKTASAADWAGEKPNLLNVAVTRARNHLYVIGDANVWHNRGYFSDLEKALPKAVYTRRQ